MARQPKPEAINTEQQINHEAFNQALKDSNEMALIDQQLANNAAAIAQQLGYQGQMITVGVIEDEIRLYQRRTAECVLQLGTRLLILKELTPHGEFTPRIELLGFSQSSAKRFMQAALKFSKTTNLGVLTERIDSQAKLLELVTMDDEDLEQLANGETVLGLHLDDIDTMTAKELKAALREAKANEEARARILAEKNAAMDKMATQLQKQESRTQILPPDEVAQQLRHELMAFGYEAENAIANKFIPGVYALLEHAQMHGGDESSYVHGLLLQIEQCCAMVRQQFPAVDKQLLMIDLTEPLPSEHAAAIADTEITAEDLKQLQ